MKGFKDFVMRGNLVELAVAFIIAGAFGTVVKTFTELLLGIIGKAGGRPDFNSYKPAGLPVGIFITALVSFLILAFIVYFFVVKPYEMAKARYAKVEEDAAPDESVVLLKEIRDALQSRA
ncbi:large conductance mechanosensitive channel [Pedococcus dokdonensis]|uniref:Large conductance mechanosensitive channel n=1 Tax=Pedococcus dokdonensis TaxID=443156 RepID=A0A1H0SEI1_9MICO|nr:large conductance mechanosensitive channel protein MscL [Pedococcus dokdonensis]SDP40183.1 large conductance mechanosensitive channel [Pedococcus dokdonensis]